MSEIEKFYNLGNAILAKQIHEAALLLREWSAETLPELPLIIDNSAALMKSFEVQRVTLDQAQPPENELQRWQRRALDAETRLAIRASQIEATEAKSLLPFIGQSLGMTYAESIAIASDPDLNTWSDLVAKLEKWLSHARTLASGEVDSPAQPPEGMTYAMCIVAPGDVTRCILAGQSLETQSLGKVSWEDPEMPGFRYRVEFLFTNKENAQTMAHWKAVTDQASGENWPPENDHP